MKIYFTAAISQQSQFGDIYKRIVTFLEKENFQVQHHNIENKTLENVKAQNDTERASYYRKSIKMIAQADLIVVEASYPSTLNIGHEITLALEKGKPVIVLYKKGHDAMFLSSLESEKLVLAEYTDNDIEQVLQEALDFAKDQADVRFNFFISPTHVAYLDKIAKDRRIPRSVYLRELIERDMKKNKEYSEVA